MFLDLLGQNVSKKVLLSLIQRNISGKSIFIEGPPHVGKMHACYLTAMGVFCKQKSSSFGCGLCIDCVHILKGMHPQVLVLTNEDSTPTLIKFCEFFLTNSQDVLEKKNFLQTLLYLTWQAIYQAQFFVLGSKEKENSLWEKIFSLAMSIETKFAMQDFTLFDDVVTTFLTLYKKLQQVQGLPGQILRKDVLRFFERNKFLQQEPTVFIVQNIGMLHPDSIFMLLKLLEDSLQNNLFFFLSHDPIISMNPLFRPILSRCLRLKFSSLLTNFRKDILQNNFFINPSQEYRSTTNQFSSHIKIDPQSSFVDFLGKIADNRGDSSLSPTSKWSDVLLCRWISSASQYSNASSTSLGVYERVGQFFGLNSHKRG